MSMSHRLGPLRNYQYRDLSSWKEDRLPGRSLISRKMMVNGTEPIRQT